MPGYIDRAIQKFVHPPPRRPQPSPHVSILSNFDQTQQLATLPNTSPPLDQSGIRHVQEVVGTLLYHARSINSPLLAALNTVGSAQTTTINNTTITITQLLDYCTTHPNPNLRFTCSSMILRIHSDASYLSLTKARSRAAGFFYMSYDSEHPPINGTIRMKYNILKNVMASAAKAETGAVFVNCREATIIQQVIIEIGHPQPTTLVHEDNKCAVRNLNETFKQKNPNQWICFSFESMIVSNKDNFVFFGKKRSQ